MRFSVIVPVYNFESYIEKCIESILRQICRDFELIVVDDGSKDKTPEICDKYAARDERVKVIHKENKGVVNSRKTGIFAAKGDYIVYVDADDWVEPGLLEELSEVLDRYPDIDIVIYDALKIMPSGNSMTESTAPEGYYDRYRMENEIFPDLIQDRKKGLGDGKLEPLPWNKAYRRKHLMQHYCLDERITVSEDSAFCYECILAAKDIYILKKTLYNYNRFNPDSAMIKYNPKLMQSSAYEVDYVCERLKEYEAVRMQLPNHVAARIVYSIGHEVRNNDIKTAAENIRRSLKSTGILKHLNVRNMIYLRPMTLVYIIALKLHLYAAAVRITKRQLGINR
ncbi:MAG: glycosyltransferase family 2 protein [Lachnospiraceae bacterium]|nr:glycosyltransferase family 2 protein [Lachnospiraceae bacterium]